MSYVVLVNTSFELAERKAFYVLCPPLGLLAVAAALEEAGHEVELIDPQLTPGYEGALAAAVARKPLFVGMTTFMGPNVLNARKVTGMVKELDASVPVVWGGPLATSSPQLCFDESAVDHIVLGMGEETVVKLAVALEAGEDVGAVPHVMSAGAFPGGKKDVYAFSGDLDALPVPRLDLWAEGLRQYGVVPIFSSRGCPRNCAFCYNNMFTGRKCWYGRSPDSILAEMRKWSDAFGMRDFYFVDDNFLVHTRRAVEILDRCKEEGFSIGQVLGHLEDFKPEVLDRIFGFIGHVGFSVESASPKIQRLLNKVLDLEKVKGLLRKLTQGGIPKITTNFMFGLPTETDEDIRANIVMANELREINPEIRIIPYVYTPQPEDDIVAHFEWRKDIRFTLDNLSYIDMSPNRSNVLLPEIRPWMKEGDIEFYLDFVLAWFYHFDHVVRADQGEVLKHGLSHPRVVELFSGIPAPA